MTPPAVTLGEVIRRLDELSRSVITLADRLDVTYIRRDVYAVQRATDDENLRQLREDLDAIVKQQRENRRLAMSGIVLPVLATIIAALILAVVLP